jgi:superfamily II DNA or RNA helicase
MRILKREALYIRSKEIPADVRDELIQDYTLMFYDDRACENCEYLADRHCEICDNCASFKGGARLASKITVGENKYIKFPRGDLKGLVKKLRNHNVIALNEEPRIVEKHPEPTPFHKPFKFTGKLRDSEQRKAAAAIFEHKIGVLQFPPRGGKTVLGSYCITHIGEKAIIVAGQKDWLDGFYETFCGSDTQEPLTTAKGSGVDLKTRNANRRLFKKNGTKFNVGFCNTYDDFLMHDICLVTEQTFRSDNGKKLLERVKNMFTVMFVDEIQYGAAPLYAVLLSAFNVEYLIGLTGTPDRKDTKNLITEKIVGPILYKGKLDRLRAEVRTVMTDYSDDRDMTAWTSIVGRLEGDKKRQKLIAKYAVKDVSNEHMILIPMQRVKAIEKLVLEINKQAGARIAAPFHGGMPKLKRKKYIDLARNYKIKVLVGNTKLLSVGINIPRASCQYDVTPSSNIPNAEQRYSRTLTKYEGKPRPLFRVFMDHVKVRKRCFSNEFWNCMMPRFRPIISDKDMKLLKDWMSNKIQQRIDL